MKKIMSTSEALLLGSAAAERARLREQEVAVWILVIGLVVLSLFTGYLLWAKVASLWPFQF
jgi:hypothetical protein